MLNLYFIFKVWGGVFFVNVYLCNKWFILLCLVYEKKICVNFVWSYNINILFVVN